MRTKRKDGIETRERLLDAACGVFAAKGFQDASIAGICEDAGASVARHITTFSLRGIHAVREAVAAPCSHAKS